MENEKKPVTSNDDQEGNKKVLKTGESNVAEIIAEGAKDLVDKITPDFNLLNDLKNTVDLNLGISA